MPTLTPDEVAQIWEGNAEAWTQLARRGLDVYRDAHNTPAFFAMLPPVTGLIGLDVGCGEGYNTRLVAGRGAQVTAVDIAPTFIRHAQEQESAQPLGITYQVADGMALPFPDASFDFVVSFMALMDMPDQAKALAGIARVLKPGGFVQFSILHPCFVPPYRKTLREPDRSVRAIEVGRYFETESEVRTWLFSTLPHAERLNFTPFKTPLFHRTLSSWVHLIRASGLVIEEFREPCATLEEAQREPVIADTRVAPLFLHIRASKP